jgi:glucose uptake protein GlcU
MFIVSSLGLAIVFCVITMLGWGSWANTQKLAGKDKWPFQLYYWDYAVGVLFLSLVFMFTLGSLGSSGMGAVSNLSQAGSGAVLRAVLSGVLFNISNILLVVAIDAAGMSVAFPVGVGLAVRMLRGRTSAEQLHCQHGVHEGAKLSYADYFRGGARLHSLGFLGGIVWALALGCDLIASGAAGPAISYALGQGATLVAAIWGVLIWKEFRGAPKGTAPFVVLMFVGYTLGLALIGLATL